MTKVLITGSSGFIGHHLALRLLDEGCKVTGVDAMTPVAVKGLKDARLARLTNRSDFRHIQGRIEDPPVLRDAFESTKPDIVVHLAAEAGVRPSIEDPRKYMEANIKGTFELLEAMRAHPPKHSLLASTSSAYGAVTDMPYHEGLRADWPVSPYAATKKSTEVLAHAYAHIWDLPITMFRFFTVYGPWGRPDMAYWLFAKAILEDRPIKVFNHGKMSRDFVFIDDLVEAIRRLIDTIPGQTPPVEGDSLSPVAPWRLVNIGKSDPDTLMEFIEAIESALDREAIKNFDDMQAGDVPDTWADASLLKALTGYLPDTPLTKGIPVFTDWLKGQNSTGSDPFEPHRPTDT